MPFASDYRPGMTADEFTLGGNRGGHGSPRPAGDLSAELAALAEARRDLARLAVKNVENYYGPGSRQAVAAAEARRDLLGGSSRSHDLSDAGHARIMNQLRAAGSGPGSRSELVPAPREAPPAMPGPEAILEQLRRADPASRRQPDHGNLAGAIAAELRKRGIA
ncbi:MAG: hypothetical protein M3Z06_14560 [Actinomycetota bacterium]|nr:hypothetical protein [Actinomycetota bacterium]